MVVEVPGLYFDHIVYVVFSTCSARAAAVEKQIAAQSATSTMGNGRRIICNLLLLQGSIPVTGTVVIARPRVRVVRARHRPALFLMRYVRRGRREFSGLHAVVLVLHPADAGCVSLHPERDRRAHAFLI